MKILIVGQGLAGTLAGFRFEERGQLVHYIDAPGQTSASSVAAGIVNPITGRRFVKSWRIDELLPAVYDVYGRLAELLGKDYWHPQALIRTLYNRGDQNDWETRSADAGYSDYLEDQPDIGNITALTTPVFAYAGVNHAGRVNIKDLVNDFRNRLVEEGRFIPGNFDYSWVPGLLNQDEPKGVELPAGLESHYDRIVFCEGWRGRDNPYFADLGHSGNKGEVLYVRTEAPSLDRMFKHRVFLVPIEHNLYWVGATSENQFQDDSPTVANRQYLEDRLNEVLAVPYEIVAHRAAVRPTVRDRRMIIGAHRDEPRVLIFNGLGTKGASLGPLGAEWLEQLLLDGSPVPDEVSSHRFTSG